MSKAKIKLPYIFRNFTKLILRSLATLLSVGTNSSEEEESYPGTEFLVYRIFACLVVVQTTFAFYFCLWIILAN